MGEKPGARSRKEPQERCGLSSRKIGRLPADPVGLGGIKMPPEILFHRYFQTRPHLLRDGYRRKADLDRLRPQTLPVSLLESLQHMIKTALQHPCGPWAREARIVESRIFE